MDELPKKKYRGLRRERRNTLFNSESKLSVRPVQTSINDIEETQWLSNRIYMDPVN